MAMLAVMVSCSREPASLAPEAEAALVQRWIGRWNGPEGTSLEVGGVRGNYTVTIVDLDGARTFPATITAEGISFERGGLKETVKPTDGAATGMKWLAGKSNCLTVTAGEGYCRD